MIKIGKPYIEYTNESAILKAVVDIPVSVALKYKNITGSLKNCPWRTNQDYPPKAWEEGQKELSYETNVKYADCLCTERSDAYVIAMLWYGILTGEDIAFEAPLSECLYYGLTERLIPALCGTEYKPIRLIGSITNEALESKNAIGVGMSCGVDSFYSLRMHDEVTHLAFYECGHIFHLNNVLDNPSIQEFYDYAYKLADKRAGDAAEVAKQSGKEFVYVKSNLDENFYRGGIIYRSMYANLSCSLAMQKLYKVFISSSSGHNGDLEVKLIAPTQNYENLICESCRTETMKYVSSDFERRFHKLEKLSKDALAAEYLEVCFNFSGHNCGKCYGCLKTMVVLDQTDVLENFNKVFDLEDYYANRRNRLQILADGSKRPELSSIRESWTDIVEYARLHDGEVNDMILEIDNNGNK